MYKNKKRKRGLPLSYIWLGRGVYLRGRKMDDLRMEDLRRKINFAIDEAYNRGWQQGRNNVKPLIDEIHENVYNEGRQKGVADTVDKAIELLKAYPTVTAMKKIKELKLQS